MTPEIRQVTEISPSLTEAFARLMPQLSPRIGEQTPERLQTILESPSTALFAAWAGEKIVGVLTLVWYDVSSGRKAWIEDVVVDSAARGCGAGEALTRHAVAHATALGVEKIYLTSAPAREAARTLYRKIGFEEAPTTVFVLRTDTKKL